MALDNLKPIAKAIVGFVTPGVVAAVAAVQDGSPGGTAITMPEWVGIAAAMVITGGAVFAVPNKVKPTAADLTDTVPGVKAGLHKESAALAPEYAVPDDWQSMATVKSDVGSSEPTPDPTPGSPAPVEDPVKALLKAAIETVRASSNALNDARAAAAKAAVDASS